MTLANFLRIKFVQLLLIMKLNFIDGFFLAHVLLGSHFTPG